jgi:hypothetical protein
MGLGRGFSSLNSTTSGEAIAELTGGAIVVAKRVTAAGGVGGGGGGGGVGGFAALCGVALFSSARFPYASCFCCIFLRYNKKRIPPRMTKAPMTPIATPAAAPGASPLFAAVVLVDGGRLAPAGVPEA